ncbi:uncharacterized protein [Ptychodera flava]|uniref:uncharacterized protein n=1 Tax=Ptychodera flava TaxID=63121 RepID=UPI00396A46C1
MLFFCSYSDRKVVFSLIVVVSAVATILFSLWESELKFIEEEVSKYRAAIDTVIELETQSNQTTSAVPWNVETPRENAGSELIEHSVSPSPRRTETKLKNASYFLQNHSFVTTSPSAGVEKHISSFSEAEENVTSLSETVDNTILPSTNGKNANSSSGSTMNISARRFLVSVHYDFNGPNVHYEAFRAGLAYAFQEKRTIVEPYFFTHWTQGLAVRRKRLFNETFDLSKLRQIVDYATVEEFNKECNHTIEVLLVDPAVTVDRDAYLDRAEKYLRFYDIKLPEFHDLHIGLREALSSYSKASSVKCLGVYMPSFWTSPLTQGAALSDGTIDRHLVYAKPIRRLGETIASIMCDGNAYMSLHWRNRSGEVCKPNRGTCTGEDLELIEAVNKTAIAAAKDINIFMQEHNVSCIYVALPPFAKAMFQFLRAAGVPNVVGVDDLMSEKYHEAREVVNDNYIMSLVEQEICIGAKIFVSSKASSWSRRVRQYRTAFGLQSMYLADIITWKDPRVALRK